VKCAGNRFGSIVPVKASLGLVTQYVSTGFETGNLGVYLHQAGIPMGRVLRGDQMVEKGALDRGAVADGSLEGGRYLA